MLLLDVCLFICLFVLLYFKIIFIFAQEYFVNWMETSFGKFFLLFFIFLWNSSGLCMFRCFSFGFHIFPYFSSLCILFLAQCNHFHAIILHSINFCFGYLVTLAILFECHTLKCDISFHMSKMPEPFEMRNHFNKWMNAILTTNQLTSHTILLMKNRCSLWFAHFW